MKKFLPILVLLLVPVVAYTADPPAAPYVKLPATVKGEPGAFIQISADTNGTTVSWAVVDPGLNLFPVSLLKDSKTAVVSTGTPGSYRVYAVPAQGDGVPDFAACTGTAGAPLHPPLRE